jgi:hypothetical protein
MSKYRYTLEQYKGMSTRYRCPICQQKNKTFSLYIDSVTGEHIHNTVGRCDRESSCGYHYTPKQYFQDNKILFDKSHTNIYTSKPFKNQTNFTSHISIEIFKASLCSAAFETNHFVKFLIKMFGDIVVSKLISNYFIATSKYWKGATVFWQIDANGKVRTGKIMLYNPATGKRVKKPHNYIHWAHKALEQPLFELKQCLFGEHLIIDKTKPIALVESEKTAIIMSVFKPEYSWLATGSKSGFKYEFLEPIKEFKIVAFPDKSEYNDWLHKATELNGFGFKIAVNDWLEKQNKYEAGTDLADVYINELSNVKQPKKR